MSKQLLHKLRFFRFKGFDVRKDVLRGLRSGKAVEKPCERYFITDLVFLAVEESKRIVGENIPLGDDIDEYMEKNVLPYNPLAFLDRKKDKIGYEIPFTRLFYKFTAPQSSTDIFAEIKALEEEETALMKELFGNA